jgi:hypothetical protein
MQKPFVENSSNKINNNNNNSSNVTDTGNSQGQINISQNPFQQKATKIMDSVPTHKIRVGDMDVAYKQFGKGGGGLNHLFLLLD